MAPFLKYQNLWHRRWDTDPSLFWRGEHLITGDIREETAEFKHAYASRFLKRYAMCRILLNLGDRVLVASHVDFCSSDCNKFILANPVTLLYGKDETDVVIGMIRQMIGNPLRRIMFRDVSIAKCTREGVDRRIR